MSYVDSRFWFSDQDERSKRRRQRVTTLVGWRLVALAAAGLAILWRLPTLDQIGRAILHTLEAVPAVAGLLEGFRSLPWTPVLIAIATIALVFFVAYLVVAHFLYDPWDAKDAADAVRPELPVPYRPGALWRTAIVLLVFIALAWFVIGL